MSNIKENNKRIPPLRFPEFKDCGEWELIPLGEVIIKNTEKNKYSKYTLVQSVSNKYGFINQDKYFDGRNVASKDVSKYYVIKKGYFAYNPSRIDVGSLSYKFDDNISVISPLYVSFKALKGKIVDLFLKEWFSTEGFKSQMIFEGGVRNTLNYENLIRIKVPLSILPEQQKIAAFLFNLDELIEAHRQKLALLKQHKKGLMQNLFPQEGEKVPKLRFPEFNNEREWKYVNGNELFESISNKNHNSGLPILAITQKYGAIPRDMIDYTVIASKQSIKGYKAVEKGDFVISLRSFQGGIEYSYYEGICSPAYIILRKKQKLVDIFFKYYFKTDLYIHQLNINIEGIRDGKMISYKQFSEIKLPFPVFPEQQKIAACLSSLDELIAAQEKKTELLKKHKKGLMQRVFPMTN